MARHILKCPHCKEYSMNDTCSACGEKTLTPRPPKYSPEDKYGGYRRTAKKMMEGQQN